MLQAKIRTKISFLCLLYFIMFFSYAQAIDFTDSSISAPPAGSEGFSDSGFTRMADVYSSNPAAFADPEPPPSEPQTAGLETDVSALPAYNTDYSAQPAVSFDSYFDDVTAPLDISSSGINEMSGLLAENNAFQQSLAQIQVEQNLDTLLTLLDPPFTDPSQVNLALDILAPIVDDLNVRAPLKEQIGEAALSLVSQQDIDPQIRTSAVSKVLFTLSVDSNISAPFKETMGAQLQNIVFNEPVTAENQAAMKELKKTSLTTLSTIVEDADVSPSFKENLITPLLGLQDDPDLGVKSLIMLDKIVSGSNISTAGKEALLSPMLSLVQETKTTNPNKALLAEQIMIDVAKDPRLSTASKENLIQPTITLINDSAISDKLKMQGLMLLRNMAWDPSISPASKSKITTAFQTVTIGPESKELYTNLKLDTLVGLFLDNDVDPAVKEQSVDSVLSIVSSKNLSPMAIQYAVEVCGGIAQDPEVSASAKEKLITPVETLINDNLAVMKTDPTWYTTLKFSLGLLTALSQDTELPTSTKDNIRQWITDADIFNTRSSDIWDEFNVLTIGHSSDYFNSAAVPAIYNVLNALPEGMRPAVISLEDLNNPQVTGYYSISNATIGLGYTEDNSAQAYESNLLHEIGHYVFYNEKMDAALQNKLQELWQQSSSLLDYSRPYASTAFTEDIASTFQDYMVDSENLVGRATLLAQTAGIQDDGLLAKASVFAQVFAHEKQTSTGEKTYTYVYDIASNGAITRKETALTQQTINGKTYLLPDMSQIISQTSYDTRI